MRSALARFSTTAVGGILLALSFFVVVFFVLGTNVPLTLAGFILGGLALFILAKPEYGLYLLLLNALAETSAYFEFPRVGPLSFSIAIEGVLVFAFLFQLTLLRKRLYLKVAENGLLVTYIILVLLSVLLAERIAPGSLDVLRTRVLVVVMIYFLLINLIDTPARFLRLAAALVVTDAILVVSGVLNYFGLLEPRGIDPARLVGRTVGFIGNPNEFAFVMISIFPLVLGLVLYCRGALGRIVMIGLAVGNLFVILHTLSRGGFISLCVVIPFMAYRLSRDLRLVALLLILSVITYLFLPAALFERFEEMEGGLQHTGRYALTMIGIRMAVANPLLGVGFGNFLLYFPKYDVDHRGGATAPHNLYTSIAAQTGIPSLILYLTMLWIAFSKLSRMARVFRARGDRFLTLLSVALQASLVNVVVFGLSGHVEHTYIVFVILGMAVVLDRLYVQEGVAGRAAHELAPENVLAEAGAV